MVMIMNVNGDSHDDDDDVGDDDRVATIYLM